MLADKKSLFFSSKSFLLQAKQYQKILHARQKRKLLLTQQELSLRELKQSD
jgi:hypothetical protein